MSKGYESVTECRVCRGTSLDSYLNLGNMPLANRVITPEDIGTEKKFPLDVLYCGDCSFSQLSVVVDPGSLFQNYVYRSGMSRTFKDHCEGLAEKLGQGLLDSGDLVVDIASNDGTLLQSFKSHGYKVVGVDPAENLAAIANEAGITTIPSFWNRDVAERIRGKYGPVKAITAFNVFAHVDDVHGFVSAAEHLLAHDGYLIVESPHIKHLVGKCEFDTVYHEHLSYLAVKPLQRLMGEHGMRIARVEETPLHGGSIRLYMERTGNSDHSDGSTDAIIHAEEVAGLHSIDGYNALGKRATTLRGALVRTLDDMKRDGKTIAGFGAAAKGTILANSCGIDNGTIDFIVDDTPEKQGKLMPGVHIPIVSRDMLARDPKDAMVIFPWNFAREIIGSTKQHQERGGVYVIPIPEVKVVRNESDLESIL